MSSRIFSSSSDSKVSFLSPLLILIFLTLMASTSSANDNPFQGKRYRLMTIDEFQYAARSSGFATADFPILGDPKTTFETYTWHYDNTPGASDLKFGLPVYDLFGNALNLLSDFHQYRSSKEGVAPESRPVMASFDATGFPLTDGGRLDLHSLSRDMIGRGYQPGIGSDRLLGFRLATD